MQQRKSPHVRSHKRYHSAEEGSTDASSNYSTTNRAPLPTSPKNVSCSHGHGECQHQHPQRRSSKYTSITSLVSILCVTFFIYMQIFNASVALNLHNESNQGGNRLLRRQAVDTQQLVSEIVAQKQQQQHQQQQLLQQQGVESSFAFQGDDVVHVVYTRFMQTQHKLLELGKARAELFRAFCLPSMVSQTKQNFLWVIRTDPLLEPQLLQQLKEWLRPYPHFLLISSNSDKLGIRDVNAVSDLLNSTKVLSGDPTLPQVFHAASRERTVLETRLDADDALHIEFLESMQTTARQVFGDHRDNNNNGNDADASGKWMYWCADVHMEWHPGNVKYDRGILLARAPKHCVTPGLTLGYDHRQSKSDIPSFSHHKLMSSLPTCADNATSCVQRMELIPSSLRARTVTSAGMADVGLDVNGRTSDKWWDDVYDTFGIHRNDAVRCKAYLQQHTVDIAIENLKGQCSQGHSCKKRAKERLNALLAQNGRPPLADTSTAEAKESHEQGSRSTDEDEGSQPVASES